MDDNFPEMPFCTENEFPGNTPQIENNPHHNKKGISHK